MHLIRQPRHLIPYIKTNVLGRASALELELPWIAYAAIDFLNGFAKPAMVLPEKAALSWWMIHCDTWSCVAKTMQGRIRFFKVSVHLAQGLLPQIFSSTRTDREQSELDAASRGK